MQVCPVVRDAYRGNAEKWKIEMNHKLGIFTALKWRIVPEIMQKESACNNSDVILIHPSKVFDDGIHAYNCNINTTLKYWSADLVFSMQNIKLKGDELAISSRRTLNKVSLYGIQSMGFSPPPPPPPAPAPGARVRSPPKFTYALKWVQISYICTRSEADIFLYENCAL